MTWLNDLFYFLLVPGLVVVAFVLSYRGSARKYKIVKATNTLGEVKYEVWFDYHAIHGSYTWKLEEKFDTEDQANQFIARRFTIREVIREGKL